MSDKMYPPSLKDLLSNLLKELREKDSICSIPVCSFFNPTKMSNLASYRYGSLLETPLGLAAGPHTQLASNIISGWLVGARYIELKTVQVLDELQISKPCIDMEDEGFNCEWSQELKLDQSFEEYFKAFVIIHILQKELNFRSNPTHLGTIFNMSVGYNLEGILSEGVSNFITKMRNCSDYLQQAKSDIKEVYPPIDNINFNNCISNSITLSTMHGCPPDEIQKIASYLLDELKVHTTIKLNPTLNGREKVYEILHEKLEFHNIDIPDNAFEHDLKFEEALKIISNLQKKAQENNLHFGIKLTNTLESVNNKEIFSKKNEMMYMSGRALHPLAVNLSIKLLKSFKGELDISFCAGLEAFNLASLLKCGLKPLTVCTDLLKPGGYERFTQYIENISTWKDKKIDISKKIKFLEKHLLNILKNPLYKKSSFPWKNIKGNRPLTPLDCIKAPCIESCPTNQNIPEYIHLANKGHYQEAQKIIYNDNPFPYSTGLACDHQCQDRCTRINFDSPVNIRHIKRALAKKDFLLIKANRKLSKKVAIVGGGPSGLSAAYYLAKEGFKVEIFERENLLGGMLTNTLPEFRAPKNLINKDIKRILTLGVKVHLSTAIDSYEKYLKLKKDFNYVYLATGAPLGSILPISNDDIDGVYDFITFLKDIKKGKLKKLPKRVAICGGGNSAIDSIRSAKRIMPANGQLYLLYRRSKQEMPALREEIHELLYEGITIKELTNPIRLIPKQNKLVEIECVKMELKDLDTSLRPRPVPILDSNFKLKIDLLVWAIGQDFDTPFLREEALNNQNYAGGDLLSGPATIVKALASGKEAALSIINKENIINSKLKTSHNQNDISLKNRYSRVPETPIKKLTKAQRNNFKLISLDYNQTELKRETARCLRCDQLCNICITVCPNRANRSFKIQTGEWILNDLIIKDNKPSYSPPYHFYIKQEHQVYNLGDLCNECGNCQTFCPTSGAPYLHKPKIYYDKPSFLKTNNNAYHLDPLKKIIMGKINCETYQLEEISQNEFLLNSPLANIIILKNNLKIINIDKINGDGVLSFAPLTTLLLAITKLNNQ